MNLWMARRSIEVGAGIALLALSIAAPACSEEFTSGSTSAGGAAGAFGGTAGYNSGGTTSGSGGQKEPTGGTAGAPTGGSGGTAGIAGNAGNAGEGGTAGGIAGQAGQGGTECNSHANTAASVTVKTVSGAAPKGSGGEIFNGKYHLTEATDYDGFKVGTWVTRRETLVISEGYIGNFVVELRGSPDIDARVTVWFSPSGISPGATYKCGPQGPDMTSYTATPTTLTLFTDSQVVVYTRQ